MTDKNYQAKYNKEGKGSLVRMNIMIPREQYKRLVAWKNKEERPISFFIKKAIEKALKELK